MPDVLTLSEMCERFQGEWLLIEDPEVDHDMEVIRGTVTCHSKDRNEVDRVALERRPRNAAYRYTGEIPNDMEFAL